MKIIRNNKEIELTSGEVYAAHKEFITNWMTETAKEILGDNDIPEEIYVDIGEAAYDTYASGNGLTEYEAVKDAVEKYQKSIS
jgi:hypothetical protein